MAAQNLSATNGTNWFPGRQCIDTTVSIPLSLQYSDEIFWPATINFAKERICYAPGCLVIQSYNITSKGTGDNYYLNVTDTEDIRRRCERAQGTYERESIGGGENGTRIITGYCSLREIDHVGPLVSNLSGLARVNVACSTQQYRQRDATGRGMKVAVVLIGVAVILAMAVSV